MTVERDLRDLLRRRAEHDPDNMTYAFIDSFADTAAATERAVTNKELYDRALVLAARLRETARPADRVLVLNRPGLDYVVGLYACLLAGMVAVPAYPPDSTRIVGSTERIRAIAVDSGPRCALVDDNEVAVTLAGSLPGTTKIEWIVTPEADRTTHGAQPPSADPAAASLDDLAVLQYTSGSTAAPKGVMLSHANLMHNLAAQRAAFGLEDMNGVFWLPPYHDMGLIGGIFMALYCGGRTRLFSPQAFLRDPIRWLRVMSDVGADISAAPDFAYEMCARRGMARPRDVAELDLSRWRVAISGAEPVRPDTLELFAEVFAPAGFRANAFSPSFGLAENTLLTTASCGGYSMAHLAAQDLQRHRVSEIAPGPTARRIVGCGASADPHQRVVIVDPDTRRPRGPDSVGEIWVAGGSVARGYWNHDDDTRSVFGASLADTGEGPFLRTGDLGFIRDGELFVTGRLKDVVVLRGQNHYPQDLERTAEQSHPSVRSGRCVAFSVDDGREETLVMAVEAIRVGQESARTEIAAAIRERIGVHHDVSVHDIVFVPRPGIPRTSSGKLRRSAVRATYLAGGYLRQQRSRKPYTAPRDDIERVVAAAWSRALGVERVGMDDRFFELGGDSLKVTRLLGELNADGGYELTLSDVADVHTVAEFADLIREYGAGDAKPGDEVHVDLG